MGGSASYRLARKIRAAEQNGASQDEIDALRRQREAALAVEREKRQRQRDQNENRVRIPDGVNIPTGSVDGSEYTRPQVRMPSGAYFSDNGEYTIVRPGERIPETPQIILPEITTTGTSRRPSHSKAERDARKKLTKEQKALIREIEKAGDDAGNIYSNRYIDSLEEIAEALGIPTENRFGNRRSSDELRWDINSVIGSSM